MTAASIIAVLGACAALHAQAVDVCNPGKFEGAYGFQLSGRTTISGTSKPVASIGRVIFDGHGAISGESSVNFAGYYLGNPVTGKYALAPDCTLIWSLQDDSGAWQHFMGKMTPDLLSARFQQSDPGAAQNGTMQKVAQVCSLTSVAPAYRFSISGNIIPMQPGEPPPHPLDVDGTMTPDQAGNVKLDTHGTTGAGTLAIDSDCVATMTLNLPSGTTLQLRGVLVENGKRIIAVDTDPGATVTANFTPLAH